MRAVHRTGHSRLALRALACLATFAVGALLAAGCATGARESRDNLLDSLRAAMQEPVTDAERNRAHSRLVQDVVESDVLQNMTRQEVAEAIGRGERCSSYPRCNKLGFEGDDWYYEVGEAEGGDIPLLIIGFDHTGHVIRTWNLRTH